MAESDKINRYSDQGNMFQGRYQLRNAAGLYWLLDMEQPGVPYRKPLPMNETGAMLWSMVANGMSRSKISEYLCETFGIPEEEAQNDVQEFFKQLENYKVDFGGQK